MSLPILFQLSLLRLSVSKEFPQSTSLIRSITLLLLETKNNALLPPNKPRVYFSLRI